eukprot:8759421-Pyramimonas_sp.AAC.1
MAPAARAADGTATLDLDVHRRPVADREWRPGQGECRRAGCRSTSRPLRLPLRGCSMRSAC